MGFFDRWRKRRTSSEHVTVVSPAIYRQMQNSGDASAPLNQPLRAAAVRARDTVNRASE